MEQYEAELARDANLVSAYFFLANSYDDLHTSLPAGWRRRHLSAEAILKYRIAYGPEKLNDPSEAVAIARRMFEIDPMYPPNYVVLSRIYEDARHYDATERALARSWSVAATASRKRCTATRRASR